MSNIRKTFNFRDGVQVDDEALVVKGAVSYTHLRAHET